MQCIGSSKYQLMITVYCGLHICVTVIRRY